MKRQYFTDKVCENCRKSFNRYRSLNGRLEGTEDYRVRKYCSKRCCNIHKVGDRHHNYKDGLRRGHDCGYLRVTGGKYLHRVIMERYLGKKLRTNEHIHHVDGNVVNNNISNLEIVNNSAHRKIHAKVCKRDRRGRFSK